MTDHWTLTPQQLYRHCDTTQLGFASTAELAAIARLDLQPRAAEALDFGLGMQRPGYNLFVMGSPGIGRHDAVLERLRANASQQPSAADLCAVQNFHDPYAPAWLRLPAGRAEAFAGEVRLCLEQLAVSLQAAFRAPQWRQQPQDQYSPQEEHERIKSAQIQLTQQLLTPLWDTLHRDWQNQPQLLQHLRAMAEDLLKQVARLRHELDAAESIEAWLEDADSLAARYAISPVLTRGADAGAPVEYCRQPNRETLFGWGEQRIQEGALFSDFHLLRVGALQHANGGYLLLDAERVLADLNLWRDLKQVLARGQVLRECNPNRANTAQCRPQALPVSVRVVLVGERHLYYQLAEQDPEFLRLFKVQVDFEERIEWNSGNEHTYARMLATLCQGESLLDLDAAAVARVVEQGARLADDAERLSVNLGHLADLLREADYWARDDNREQIGLKQVEQAIAHQQQRASRMRERFHEDILRDNVIIATSGRQVAQVNGLSVIEAGDYAFGLPSRITATAWLGEGEIIDIEREVELGGALHSKGVLILSQFLGSRYARTRSLSVTASLVFEQNYGPLDGDSASLGELCALLSALAELPVAQYLAVTGSVNQLGEVQAVGGVNEKVEGFFAICKARGLNGEQGVILPKANVSNLMLQPELVAAVAEGSFHLHAVDHVDQAMALLSGVEAGMADAEGLFPAQSVNGRVMSRLKEFARLRQHDDKERDDDKDKDKDADRGS